MATSTIAHSQRVVTSGVQFMGAEPVKPLPSPQPLNLASLTILDLWCLAELFEHLAHTAGAFLNQPRFSEAETEQAQIFTDALWDAYFYETKARIVEEMGRRIPANAREADCKASTIIRHLAEGDSYHDILAAVTAALKTRERVEIRPA